MATVEVTFTALPTHVRTARLVATAVARRSGVAEALLEEDRLAGGEGCPGAEGGYRAEPAARLRRRRHRRAARRCRDQRDLGRDQHPDELAFVGRRERR